MTHERIITLRQSGLTIERTAMLAECSISLVKRVWAIHQSQKIRDMLHEPRRVYDAS